MYCVRGVDGVSVIENCAIIGALDIYTLPNELEEFGSVC